MTLTPLAIPQPEWKSGNIFIRPNLLAKAGDVVAGHKHNFDHTTIVFTGAIHVKAYEGDGDRRVLIREQDYRAPAHCLIRAGVEHEITALDDYTQFWCVYSHRDAQGRVSLEWTGWMDAYY